MKYRAVLFDFDFTLADASDSIVECFNYALTRMDYPARPSDAIKATIGMSLEDMYSTLTGDGCPQRAGELAGHFHHRADQIMADDTRFFDDAIPTLRRLREMGLKTAIVSTKERFRIGEVFEKHRVSHLVDCIIGIEDVQAHKPDPEGIYKAADFLSHPPEQLLFVGDSLYDAGAAQNAGVDFVGVTTGTTRRDDFAPFPYQAVVPSLTALMSQIFSET